MTEFTQELKDKLSLVEIIGQTVTLEQKGSTDNFIGLCPFHDEKTPSFKVNNTQQFWHCFGCGESGDVFKFWEKINNVDFKIALKDLANIAGIPIPQYVSRNSGNTNDSLYSAMRKASQIYHNNLVGNPKSEGVNYLKQRGISKDVILKYQIGLAPDPERAGWQFLANQFSTQEKIFAKNAGLLIEKNKRIYDRFRNRILIPVFDNNGRITAFTGRTLDEKQSKYLNSSESSIFSKKRTLLGWYQNQKSIRQNRKVLLIEGGFDLLSLASAGIDYTCAPMGTALTEDHLTSIEKFGQDVEVIFLFDGDKSGIKAMYRSAQMILSKALSCRVVRLPDNKDPDDFIRNKGRKEFDQILVSAIPIERFIAGELLLKHGGHWGTSFIKEINTFLNVCPSKLLKQRLLQSIASAFDMDVSLFSQEFGVEMKEFQREYAPPTRGIIQLQSSRRIISFLLHYPHMYENMINQGFTLYCTDAFAYHVFSVFQRSRHPFNISEMFKNSPWEERIVKILSAGSIDSKLLAEGHPEEEFSAIRRWVEKQKEKREIEQQMNQIIGKIMIRNLPNAPVQSDTKITS